MEKIMLISKVLTAWLVSIFTTFGSIFGLAPETNNPNMMAHRGYSVRFHENTAMAFEEAAKHGAEGVETDLRITKDGVYVLCHDSAITLKDGTELTVADHTYAELTAKPLKNKRTLDDVYLCSLDEFLKIMKKYNMEFYIEFKIKFTEELANDVFNIVKEQYDISKCIFESQSIADCIIARELFPDMPIMYVITNNETDYRQCFEHKLSADIKYEIITPKMVEEFHAEGLKVGAWTCDDPFTLAYAKSLGVDYIESNAYCK